MGLLGQRLRRRPADAWLDVFKELPAVVPSAPRPQAVQPGTSVFVVRQPKPDRYVFVAPPREGIVWHHEDMGFEDFMRNRLGFSPEAADEPLLWVVANARTYRLLISDVARTSKIHVLRASGTLPPSALQAAPVRWADFDIEQPTVGLPVSRLPGPKTCLIGPPGGIPGIIRGELGQSEEVEVLGVVWVVDEGDPRELKVTGDGLLRHWTRDSEGKWRFRDYVCA